MKNLDLDYRATRDVVGAFGVLAVQSIHVLGVPGATFVAPLPEKHP
jgi:hypothetical protein